MSETAQSDPLLQVIISLLAPLLMAGGITDLHCARQAAQQAVAAYKGGQGQLVTIAQIVGFAFASLDNLRLSAAPDLSLSMKLKLRGNANALNRSTQRSTDALATNQPSPGHPEPIDQAQPEAPPAPAPEPQPAPDPGRQRERLWASAMTDVAAECSRTLATLPPSQRRAEVIRIAALNATAQQLRGGETPKDPSEPPHARQHAAQQSVPQKELMIDRTQHVQTGNHQ